MHFQTRSITASQYFLKEPQRVYGNTGVLEVDRVTGSIYSADPGVDRHHLISISSYHAMKILTLCFPRFGLTHSIRDIVDPRNCVYHQRQVVSYRSTRFLHSSNQNHSVSCIPHGCRGRCSIVLMVVSLASSSIVSPQRPPNGAPLSPPNGRKQVLLRLCSTTICGQIDRMYTYTET